MGSDFRRKSRTDSIDTILKLTFAEPIVWEGCKGRENDVYGLADGLKEE